MPHVGLHAAPRAGCSPGQVRRTAGITLLEMVVAMAILGLLIVIAYSAIVQGLQVQSSQEAVTSTQARLRRVSEVYTQELRSAVLGAVSDSPYPSDSSSVSFTLLDGGAGFQVTALSSDTVTLISDAAGSIAASGDQGM